MAPALNPTTADPSGNLQTGARIALIGMLINLVFAAAKILGGLFGNAYVLIADGIESALDIAGSFVIWGGLKLAARPPDETHPLRPRQSRTDRSCDRRVRRPRSRDWFGNPKRA